MYGESDSDFVENITYLLEAGKTSDVKLLFSASEQAPKIINNACEIIAAICKCIKDTETSLDTLCDIKELLNFVANTASADEIILQILEEIEEADSDTKFFALLNPLKITLDRIPKKKILFVAWGLNTVLNYIKDCTVPQNLNVQGKDKLLMDNYEEIQIIKEIYKNVLDFYDSLRQDVIKNIDANVETYFPLLKFLIGLLGSPLIYLNVEIFDGVKSSARLSSEFIISQTFQITRDPMILLEYCHDNSDDLQIDKLGLASLNYLVFAEGIYISETPRVYDPVYFFHNNIFLATALLKTHHNIAVEKGLKLAMSLLQNLKHIKLSYHLFDSDDHEDFCKMLSTVIIYNEVEAIRKLALNVYTSYLTSFDTRAFYILVCHLTKAAHSGFKGYTITLYKNRIVQEFSTKNNSNDFSRYLKGQRMFSLLNRFCFLNTDVNSDLAILSEELTAGDEIIATLNFLRYLAIRDTENITEIWHFFPILETMYFSNLRKAIETSRSSYAFHLKSIEEEKVDRSNKTDINVTVKGEKLLELSKSEKIKRLNELWTVADVIDSLLSRLQECIQIGKTRHDNKFNG